MKRFFFSALLALSLAAPALADGTDALHGAFVSLAKATSYHVAVDAERGTVDADFMPPNRMHMTLGPFELIVINDVTYMKRGDSWSKFELPATKMLTAQILQTRDYAKNADNYSVIDLGMKHLDSEDLHGYQVRPKSENTTGTSKPAIIYVGKDGNVHRIDVSSDRGSGVIRLSKFNAPMKIDAPI